MQRDINLGNSMLLTLSAGAEDCFWLKFTLIYNAQHPIKTATYVIPIILHSFLPLGCGVSAPTPYSSVIGEMAITKSCHYIDLTVRRTLCCRQIFLTRTMNLFYQCKAQLLELLSKSHAAGCMKTMLHTLRAFLTKI